MAYKHYTKCTPSNDFDPLNMPLVVVGGIAGFIAVIAAIILGGIIAPFLLVAGAAAGFATITAVFEYLLGGKLICLDGDKFAIGTIIGLEPPSTKSFPENLDNDYSVNVLLCPHKADIDKINTKGKYDAADLPDIDAANPFYLDFLAQEQNASKTHNIPYTGYDTAPFTKKPIFHIEAEGSRIYDVYQAFLAAWAILMIAAGIATALMSIPFIGWLLAILAMLIGAGIGAAIVAGTWAGSDDGKISDVNPTIGELHRGDILSMMGTWTYDSGHNSDGVGWNEFHPLKYLSKAERCADEREAKIWEEKINETFDDDIKNKQKETHNKWKIHPDIDGCQEEKEPDPIR